MGGGIIARGSHDDYGPLDFQIDHVGRTIVNIGPEHYMTHEGLHFGLAHYFSDVDNGNYARIRFKTPADKYIHAVFEIMASAGVLRTIYRAPGFTHNAANAISSYNRNDASDNSDPLQEACHTPSGSGNGTLFVPTVVYGAGGNPVQSRSGQTRDANEHVLRLNTVYLIEVQSLADNNKITIRVDYYIRETN